MTNISEKMRMVHENLIFESDGLIVTITHEITLDALSLSRHQLQTAMDMLEE